jgi:hypothetical protein
MDALEQAMLDHLINIVLGGYEAELQGNDDAARVLEDTAYREACDLFGDDFWYQHEKDCMKADAIECWEMLLQRLGAEA